MAINAKASGGQIEILTGIEKVSTVASKAMGIALNTALNIGVGILGTQIISAISELVNAEEEARQKAEEEMEQIKKQADTYSENAKSLGEMADEYKKLASQTNLSVDNKKRLAEIQTELIDKYGSEAKGIDLVNGKLDDEYKKINKLSQQDYLKAADNNQTAYEDAISKAKNNTDTDINGSWYQEAYKYDYIQGNFDYKKIDTTTEEKYQKLLASVEGFKRKRLASAGGVASFEVRIDGALDAEQRLKALNEAKEKLISNSTFEERTKANSTVKKMIDSLTSEANKAQDKIDEVTKYAKQEAENLVKGFAFDGKDISNITVTEYKSWVDSLVGQYANKDPKLSQAIVDYFEKIKADATALSNSNAKTETLTSWLKDNADAIDKVQTKAESLQTTFQSLSKGTITNSELVNLFQDYPQLAKYANDTDKLKGKIQELLKQNPKSLVSSLNKLKNSLTDKTEKQAVQNLIDQLTKLGNVSVDKTTESVTSLADALKDEKEVLDNISTAYSDTEQVVTDYIDAQVEKLNNEKQAVEDSYSDKITKSEASYDNQIAKIQKVIDGLDKVNEVEEKRLAIKEKENDLAEKQNDLAQKQNDMIKAKQRLENAKNNKNVLSYSESRGFYHEANQEDVQSAKDNLAQAKKDTADAKKAVKDAQDAIKQAQTDYTVSRFQEQINVLTAEKEKATKQLEKEQAKRSKAYDTEIKKWDKYKTSWSNLVNSYEQNTKKKIASQVLGTDYEEKLSKRSQTALNNFASNFNSYKDKLNKVENAIAKNEGALYAQRGKEITTYQNKLSNLEATIAKLNSSNISIKTANAVTKAATNVTMKFTDNWKKLNSAMATPTNKTFNINVDKIESNNPEQLYKDFRSIVNKIGNK